MTNSDKLVYIIVNSIPPYGYEVNQFLACMQGTKCVVRFKKKWMPEISNPESINGLAGLVILRHWETGDFIPLRKMIIHRIMPVGEIFEIEWVAGELIDYSSNIQSQKEQIEEFSQHIQSNYKQYPNESKKDYRNLVFITNVNYHSRITDDKTNDELDIWGKIVDMIGRFKFYSDIDFIKVIGIFDSSNKKMGNVRENKSNTSRVRLPIDSYFTLLFYQRSHIVKPRGDSSNNISREFHLTTDNEVIRLIKKTSPVTGKYAGHRFSFYSRIKNEEIKTELRIEKVRQDDLLIPPVTIPINIFIPTVWKIIQAISIIVFIIGTLLLFFSDILFPGNVELSRNIGIISIVLSSSDVTQLVKHIIHKLGIPEHK